MRNIGLLFRLVLAFCLVCVLGCGQAGIDKAKEFMAAGM